MDWLGPHRAPPAHRRGVPEGAATLGIYVVLVLRDLRGAKVADLVESTRASAARFLAPRGLPFGVAGNGCRGFPKPTPPFPSAYPAGLALDAAQDRHGRGPDLADGATRPGTEASSPRLVGYAGPDLAAPLWQLRGPCPFLAAPWRGRNTHHVFSPSLNLSKYILG